MALRANAKPRTSSGKTTLSSPLDRRAGAAKKKLAAPVMVFFYHHVSTAGDGPNSLDLKQFQTQIDWIRSRHEVVSLQDAQLRITAGKNKSPQVAVTFDHGYADTCRTAVPWLLAENVPFTFFVTTGNALSGQPIQHEGNPAIQRRPVSTQQLRALADAGVELGAQGRSLVDLSQLAHEDALHDQIVGSKRDLEEIANRAVRYFAFPQGMPANLSQAAFRAAFRAGYWGVCSSYGAYNLPKDDSFHLQRISGDAGWPQFKDWLTAGAQHAAAPRQFDLGDYRLCF